MPLLLSSGMMPPLLLPLLPLLLFLLSGGGDALHRRGSFRQPNDDPAGSGPGVHMSLGRAAGEVAVSWSTPLAAEGFLLYGDSPGALSSRVAATSSVLANNEAMAGPAVKAGPWRNISVHTALIADIAAGRTVFYRVSGDADADRVLNFSYSVPHQRAGAVTFAVFGDLAVKEQDGANYTLARLKEHRRRGDFDAVLHVGDIAYDLREGAGRTGDEFLVDMEEVASSVPYMTCPGNHERDCVSSSGGRQKPIGSCTDPPYTNYRARFAMPTPPAKLPLPTPMYWSTDIGAVHVIALNTDTYLLGASMAAAQREALLDQLVWLEADLQAATTPSQRAKVPWIVAIGHEMLYSSHDSGHKSQAKILREGGTSASGAFGGLEELFNRYSVDLYFSGHEHVYEHFARTYQGQRCSENNTAASRDCGLPLTKNRPVCPCTAHIVVGNAGNREFPYHNKDGSVEAFQYVQPAFEEFRSTSPAGFGLLTVHNDSVMTWRQLNARTGETIDEHIYHR
jgi:hypothetical protein